MKLATRPTLVRMLKLDRLLREERYPNARSAGAELEVHPRTIYRDLELLRDQWGAPIAFCRKRNGFYYREKDYTLPLFRMTEGELGALVLSERLLGQNQGAPFAGDLASFLNKFTAALADEITVDWSQWETAFSCRPIPVELGDIERFRSLIRAVRDQRRLEIRYFSASRNETARRHVDPYHLVSVSGEWYLAAYCHLRQEVRLFVPARIRELRTLDERFERPGNFDIADYLGGAFKVFRGTGRVWTVRLRFSPAVARFVAERTWHPSQKSKSQPDGSAILSFRLSHLLEIKRFALSYGADCEVLAPASLRAEVAEEIARMSRLYAATKGSRA